MRVSRIGGRLDIYRVTGLPRSVTDWAVDQRQWDQRQCWGDWFDRCVLPVGHVGGCVDDGRPLPATDFLDRSRR